MHVTRTLSSSHSPRPSAARRGRFARGDTILVCAALGFAWLGHAERPAQSAVTGSKNLSRCSDNRNAFWQGGGTASVSGE